MRVVGGICGNCCDSCCTDCPEEFDVEITMNNQVPCGSGVYINCCSTCDTWFSGTFTLSRTGSCTWEYEEPVVGNSVDGYDQIADCDDPDYREIVGRKIVMTITCIEGYWQIDIDYTVWFSCFVPGDPFIPRADAWGLSTWLVQYQGGPPDSVACADITAEDIAQVYSVNTPVLGCSFGIPCLPFGIPAVVSAVP